MGNGRLEQLPGRLRVQFPVPDGQVLADDAARTGHDSELRAVQRDRQAQHHQVVRRAQLPCAVGRLRLVKGKSILFKGQVRQSGSISN